MNSVYKVNPSLDVPIYQQLVDSIRVAIKNGTLPAGHQLPTVQEMTERLGIARGTIKRAYDELELAGLVEKAQGRGTFVRYQPENSGSRKEQAMAAIDGMLNQLEEMGFSPMEINIFLNLKLRERAEQEAVVKVAVVDCNSECLSHMSEQLRHINGVDLYPYLLENIEQYRRARNATIMMVSHSMEDVARLTDRLLVMNGSKLAMDGTPTEVFSRAQELLDMGLDIPEVTRIFLHLQKMGLPVRQVYTMEQAVAEIKRLKGGSAHA